MRRTLIDYTEERVTLPPEKFQPMLDFAMAMSRHFEKFGFFMGNKLILHGQLLLDDQHNMRYKQKVFVIMEITDPAPLSMPMVYCPAPWLKSGMDWHTGSDGWLCWGLPQQWRDKISALEKQNVSYQVLMKYAATWCIDSVISLLCRQWYAYRNELTEWPPEWKYWDHGQKGVLQYEREKRKTTK